MTSRSTIRRRRDRPIGEDHRQVRRPRSNHPAGRGPAGARLDDSATSDRWRSPGRILRGWALLGLPGRRLPALDFLQPGRHTYAFYTGLALAGAAGLEEIVAASPRRLARSRTTSSMGDGRRRLDRHCGWSAPSARFAPAHWARPGSHSCRAGRPARLLWVIDRVRRHVKPGERLLYEEGGKDLPGVPGPVPARPIQRAAPAPHRGRSPGRSLSARLADDQLHPVRRGDALRPAGWYRLLWKNSRDSISIRREGLREAGSPVAGRTAEG